jgi:hypothetical protein
MNPYVYIFIFSLGFGSLKGSMISTSLRAGWSHLPKRKGLASGIILSGSGFGGGLASMYILKLTNPDDIEPSMDKHDGNLYYPESLVKFYPQIQCRLCLVLTIIILTGVLLISNYKKDEDKLPKDQYEAHYSENSSSFRFEL